MGRQVIFAAWFLLATTVWHCSCGDPGHERTGTEVRTDGAAPQDHRATEDSVVPGETRDSPDIVDVGEAQPPVRLFSFAIITDTHIGEGFLDFGTPGFYDSGGEEHVPSQRLRTAIEIVEAAASDLDIHFVLALGDFTDSGEDSEFAMAGQLLDELTLPWLPLIGNHDMWPYYRTGPDSFEEAPLPTGDVAFMETFQDHFVQSVDVFPSLELAPGPVHNPELDLDSHFVNFSFEHLGTRFLCLDLVTRSHAPPEVPGIGPDGQLFDFEGGTWSWLRKQLDEHPPGPSQPVLVFAHHPLVPLELENFSQEEHDTVVETLFSGAVGQNVKAWFAGHWHVNLVGNLPTGHPMVITAATKDTSAVRVVQVFSDGSIDFETVLESP